MKTVGALVLLIAVSGAAARAADRLHGSDRDRHDSVLCSNEGRTTAAHPVVAGVRGGAEQPRPGTSTRSRTTSRVRSTGSFATSRPHRGRETGSSSLTEICRSASTRSSISEVGRAARASPVGHRPTG